jgi:hypothetical protein
MLLDAAIPRSDIMFINDIAMLSLRILHLVNYNLWPINLLLLLLPLAPLTLMDHNSSHMNLQICLGSMPALTNNSLFHMSKHNCLKASAQVRAEAEAEAG